MKKLSAIILVCAILFTALSFTACGGASLDLKEYTSVEFSGVDGEGKATVRFDSASFEEAYLKENGVSDPLSDAAVKNAVKLSAFESSLDYSVSPDKGLHAGDEVTVTFTYSESAAKEAGVSLKNTSFSLKVDSLTDAIEIDAFDPAVFNTETGVMVRYEGKAPDGYISISNKVNKDNPISMVKYKADTDGVAYGEDVTITASLSKDAEREGYVLKEETCAYPLKDVDHYLTSPDELTAADKNALKTKYETIIKSLNREHYRDADGGWYVISGGLVTNPRVGELCLLKKNDGTYSDHAFVSVYADITEGQGPDCSNSIAYYDVYDFYIKADGTLSYNPSDANSDFFATDDVAQKEFWYSYTGNFNIEKVSFD